jgi:hypothetical protein
MSAIMEKLIIVLAGLALFHFPADAQKRSDPTGPFLKTEFFYSFIGKY